MESGSILIVIIAYDGIYITFSMVKNSEKFESPTNKTSSVSYGGKKSQTIEK